MPFLLMLAMLTAAAAVEAPPPGVIEATIRGTEQPLEVDLLVRDPSSEWKKVAHRSLPAGTRRVRFDGLERGMYQVLLHGPRATESLATKIAVGPGDTRRKTIVVEPFVVTGRVTFGGTGLGAGAVLLRHRELDWRAGIELAADGTFRVPLWQRGAFSCSVRAPALPTAYMQTLEIEGPSPIRLAIDIPDGRIAGVVRDAKSGAPVAGAIVALQTNTQDHEEHVKLTTNAEGRFDFAGIKYGRHIVRIFPPQHLEPDPMAFTLDERSHLHELDVRLDPGHQVAIAVVDSASDPVPDAAVLAVADSRLRARATTDKDGRASVAVPAGEQATLFVVAAEAPFGMLHVPREATREPLRVHLARPSSSLLIRALRTDGKTMPPFSLLMRFNGELVPAEVADELAAVQGLRLATGADSEALLRNIPTGSYEFWPYRTEAEMGAILAAGAFSAPIQVDVRTGENKIAVKFAAR